MARLLAGEGADVTVVGRDRTAGERTAAELGVRFEPVDLSLMAEVRRLAALVRERHDRLDWLVQSADVLMRRRVDTAEGFEVGFATAYLSRFLLAERLLDPLRAAARAAGSAQVLHIAAAGGPGRLRPGSVPPGPWVGAFRAHGAAQGANDVLGVELAERLAGTGVRVHVANPGAVDTGIRDEVLATRSGRLLTRAFGAVMTLRSPAEVARTLVDTARRYPDDVLIGVRGRPVRVPARVRDPDLRREVWRRTEQALRAP